MNVGKYVYIRNVVKNVCSLLINKPYVCFVVKCVMNYYFIPVLPKPKRRVRRVFEARHRYAYDDELRHPT